MEDYLLKNIISIYLLVEILAAVTGIIYFNKFKNTVAKYFIYFLVYIVVFNILGYYTLLIKNDGILSFLEGTLLEKNYWLYTVCWFVGAVLFYGWYYFKILNNPTSRKIIQVTLIVFVVFSVFKIVFNWNDFFTKSFTSINIFGSILILLCVFFYLLEILQSDKILDFYKSLNFYITCAILVLWLVQTPLVFFDPYYGLADMDYVNLRSYINLIIIVFMYGMFTVGFIISNPDYD